MAEARWIKIVTDIFDDEKILLIEELPEADSIIVIWFKLLCLAGKQNNCGVFLINDRIPYTDKMLATIFRRKEATVRLALKTFEEFGMIEIIDDVITIPNWGKHQTLDRLEKKTEYMRDYMRDYRQKQKQIACKTNGKTNSDANSKANVSEADKNKDKNRDKEEDKEDINNAQNVAFETFWKHYPKKADKQKARVAFAKVMDKNAITVDELIAAVERHKRSEQWQNVAYVPYPSTWLNGSRWEDDLPEAKPTRKNDRKNILDSLRQKYAEEEMLNE